MHLTISTAATDPAQAAVASLTDTTPLDVAPVLTFGDRVPLVVDFTDGTAAPAWASDATYTLAAYLGHPDTSSRYELAACEEFTLSTATRTGTLDLAGQALRDFLELRTECGFGPSKRTRPSVVLTLQLAVTSPTAQVVTYALVPVLVRLPVK